MTVCYHAASTNCNCLFSYVRIKVSLHSVWQNQRPDWQVKKKKKSIPGNKNSRKGVQNWTV